MTETRNPSFFPEKMQILSGSALKLIAVITMLIDHIGAIILRAVPATGTPLLSIGPWSFSLYRIFRDVGRIAFPIYCFLLVEGLLHTHDRRKYGFNLLLFACISEIPWNYVHTGTIRYAKQNVFFTLFLGYMGILCLQYFWENQAAQLLLALCFFAAAWHFNADYGWKGYIFILIMYLLRNERSAQAVVGSCWLSYEWKACFAFIPINMYNGKRGFIQGKVFKYLFYAFYPAHLMILGILRYRILFR